LAADFSIVDMVLRKLAISNFAARRTRTALTIAAIALSVSLVVSVTSGYASVEGAAFKFLGSFMMSHDVRISRHGDRAIPQSLADEVARDPDVKSVLTRLEIQSTLLNSSGLPIPGRLVNLMGIQRPADRRVESMRMHEGTWFNTDDDNVAVIDQVAAHLLKDSDPDIEESPTAQLGETFEVPGPNGGRLRLKIVGIAHKPAFFASHVQTIYVPIRTLQRFADPKDPNRVTRIMIELKENASDDAFAARWKPRLAAMDPELQLRTSGDSREKLSRNLQGLNALSFMGGTVSMLAATFIVFSALSMGVAERQRSLALLRAVGAFRGQLGSLVVMEGVLLALAGIVVGIPLGLLWVKFLAMYFADVFTAGVVINWLGIGFASVGSLLAAVLASFLPAWSAMRLSPLEAMSPLARPESARAGVICALAGLALLMIDPLLMFGNWDRWLDGFGIDSTLSRAITFYGHFIIGLPALMIGYFLLAPSVVRAVEKLFARPVAAVLAVKSALLRQQLSSGVWRAAGTSAALMVGLAVLVVMQTQGRSMLDGWQLPTHFPDVFIRTGKLNGLSPEEYKKLAKLPYIADGQFMPISVSLPELGSGAFAIVGAAFMPNATMFLGVDPDLAFKMMELDFRMGNAEQAAEMLKKGRHVVITEEFHQLKGLKIGDKIRLKTPRHGMVDYTVAGVVWSPGIDVMVASFDMEGQFDQRTAASVFGSIDDAREDFGVTGVYLFAANLVPGVDKAQVREQLRVAAGTLGMGVYDVRQVKFAILQSFNRLLLLVSSVAFAAMAVSALGVTNTIMASVRSRRWQFGVLRSIGVTRGGLLRLVLAEATLLGLVGISLGLLAGLHMSIDARQLSASIIGYKPPMVIPWAIIWIGMAVVLFISLLASIAPAVGVARSEPLSLLQSGRAAT
jgi:putative ABC transport system permease protein